MKTLSPFPCSTTVLFVCMKSLELIKILFRHFQCICRVRTRVMFIDLAESWLLQLEDHSRWSLCIICRHLRLRKIDLHFPLLGNYIEARHEPVMFPFQFRLGAKKKQLTFTIVATKFVKLVEHCLHSSLLLSHRSLMNVLVCRFSFQIGLEARKARNYEN